MSIDDPVLNQHAKITSNRIYPLELYYSISGAWLFLTHICTGACYNYCGAWLPTGTHLSLHPRCRTPQYRKTLIHLSIFLYETLLITVWVQPVSLRAGLMLFLIICSRSLTVITVWVQTVSLRAMLLLSCFNNLLSLSHSVVFSSTIFLFTYFRWFVVLSFGVTLSKHCTMNLKIPITILQLKQSKNVY